MNRNYENISYFVDLLEKEVLRYEDGHIYRGVRLIKGHKRGKGGYLAIVLTCKGVKKRSLTHSIVFAYFHGIEELKKHETIDHIDNDKYNNRIENLQGLSILENNAKANNGRKLSVENVLEIRRRIDNGEFLSQLAREFGVSGSTISKIKRGLRYRTV